MNVLLANSLAVGRIYSCSTTTNIFSLDLYPVDMNVQLPTIGALHRVPKEQISFPLENVSSYKNLVTFQFRSCHNSDSSSLTSYHGSLDSTPGCGGQSNIRVAFLRVLPLSLPILIPPAALRSSLRTEFLYPNNPFNIDVFMHEIFQNMHIKSSYQVLKLILH